MELDGQSRFDAQLWCKPEVLTGACPRGVRSMADDRRAAKRSGHHWVSWVPFGLHQQHPNNYKDILDAVWDNRDNLGYAYRILRVGCCDGCSLGTTGLHDWTMKDLHLCVPMIRRRGDNGFRRVSWDEAITLIAERLRATDPHRIGWYLTARGLTNEAYYAHQKGAPLL